MCQTHQTWVVTQGRLGPLHAHALADALALVVSVMTRVRWVTGVSADLLGAALG